MSLFTALYSILAADSAVAGLAGTRIYRITLPQETEFPAVTMNGISGNPWPLNSSRTSPLEGTVVQFSCRGETNSTSINLARKIAECLHGYSGTAEDIKIGAAIVQSSPDAGTIYDSETGLYVTPLDVLVRYS